MNDRSTSRTLRLLLGSYGRPAWLTTANTTATVNFYGAEAFAFDAARREAFPELEAESFLMKWDHPERFIRIPVVTVSRSTEDPDLFIGGFRTAEIGYPEHGVDQDFDAYPIEGDEPRHFTGVAPWMRPHLTSTGVVRSIAEFAPLARHGGYGGLDGRGHVRDHNAAAPSTSDPLAALYVARALDLAARGRRG